jgi:hypothetical protein
MRACQEGGFTCSCCEAIEAITPEQAFAISPINRWWPADRPRQAGVVAGLGTTAAVWWAFGPVAAGVSMFTLSGVAYVIARLTGEEISGRMALARDMAAESMLHLLHDPAGVSSVAIVGPARGPYRWLVCYRDGRTAGGWGPTERLARRWALACARWPKRRRMLNMTYRTLRINPATGGIILDPPGTLPTQAEGDLIIRPRCPRCKRSVAVEFGDVSLPGEPEAWLPVVASCRTPDCTRRAPVGSLPQHR